MSSLTLEGATGASLGWARAANPDEDYDITFVPKRRFVLRDTVMVDEETLRSWFGRLLQCWPSKKLIDDGYAMPTKEERRELIQLPPDVGFLLTGNVDRDAGFVVSWDGGWIRGNASGFLLAHHCDINDKRFHELRSEIECLLPNQDSNWSDMG